MWVWKLVTFFLFWNQILEFPSTVPTICSCNQNYFLPQLFMQQFLPSLVIFGIIFFFFYWVPGLTAMFSTPPLNISLFKSHFPRGFSRGTSESTNCCQISSWLCTIFINCCWTLLNLFHFMKLFIMQIRWNLISDSRM